MIMIITYLWWWYKTGRGILYILMQWPQHNDIHIEEHPKIINNAVPIYNLVHHVYVYIYICNPSQSNILWLLNDYETTKPVKGIQTRWVCLEPKFSWSDNPMWLLLWLVIKTWFLRVWEILYPSENSNYSNQYPLQWKYDLLVIVNLLMVMINGDCKNTWNPLFKILAFDIRRDH